jgi:hypothetical protein
VRLGWPLLGGGAGIELHWSRHTAAVTLNPAIGESNRGEVDPARVFVWTMTFHFMERYGFCRTKRSPLAACSPMGEAAPVLSSATPEGACSLWPLHGEPRRLRGGCPLMQPGSAHVLRPPLFSAIFFPGRCVLRFAGLGKLAAR